MAKIFSLILLMALTAVCTANPARLTKLHKSHLSARQELTEDLPAQTPYPPSGIKPNIPFDLPNEQQPEEPLEVDEPEEPLEPVAPEEHQQPDNTYLPPDNLLPPAETYRPPEASGEGDVIDDAMEQELPEQLEELVPEEPEAENLGNPQSERLILANRLRKHKVRPAKLRASKLQALSAKPLRSQKLIIRPVFSSSGALVAYRRLRV